MPRGSGDQKGEEDSSPDPIRKEERLHDLPPLSQAGLHFEWRGKEVLKGLRILEPPQEVFVRPDHPPDPCRADPPPVEVEQLVRLPNGLEIEEISPSETGFIYQEVFEENCYCPDPALLSFQPSAGQGEAEAQRPPPFTIELKSGDTVVDVGANIGLFLLYVEQEVGRTGPGSLGFAPALKKRKVDTHGQVPEAEQSPNSPQPASGVRVFAFEPLPPTFRVLKANVLKHRLHTRNLGPITLCRLGIGRMWSPSMQFTFYPNMCGNSTCRPEEKDKQRDALRAEDCTLQDRAGQVEHCGQLNRESFFFGDSQTYACPMATLSWAITALDIGSKIDLLKIDVEGCELDVLLGIQDRHWECIRQVIVEVHDRADRLDRIISMLQSRGFDVALLRSEALKSLGNCNIYARRKQCE
mmetsp:Transcript_20824/g.32630  ORF Transcript_20824/g.32630 Transcript_20824/m.32630 type:complete len:411 (+) Transcript_20824:447-1679(+)|eukprot:CAMPEP_0184310908 /NCGR_PEP_ID=MMETSP1049-20130417/36188_1 /TAXON_ID=77928 /ORGANISM="Proteomonas sulcata, Strain CCMP704" /LENGTH=410 /DNA_ID=CAMNT_0026625717 /DNA_START=390 /DNA_END=1622 /DNA_ORIENTATION=+